MFQEFIDSVAADIKSCAHRAVRTAGVSNQQVSSTVDRLLNWWVYVEVEVSVMRRQMASLHGTDAEQFSVLVQDSLATKRRLTDMLMEKCMGDLTAQADINPGEKR